MNKNNDNIVNMQREKFDVDGIDSLQEHSLQWKERKNTKGNKMNMMERWAYLIQGDLACILLLANWD